MPTPEETKAAEEAVMVGGPETDLNKPAEVPAQQEMNTEPADETKGPIYTGLTGDLNSQEELVAHTRNLEKKLFDKKMEENKPAAPEVPAETASPEAQQIENLWYTDPLKAKENIINEATKKLRAELKQEEATKKAEQNFYNELYTENPDLKGMERVVKSVVTEKWGTIKELTTADAKKYIAKESRTFAGDLMAARGVKGAELPQGQVVTTGASGSTPPAKTETLKSLNFGEQLKQMQAKHKVTG